MNGRANQSRGAVMSKVIEVKGLEKSFNCEQGEVVRALNRIDLTVEESEFICILGPSGSGKSTLLRLISGLDSSTGGEIRVRGNIVKKPVREAGMVFQEYSLLPWRNIIDNVVIGLEFRNICKKESYEIGYNTLEKMGLKGFSQSYPHELSGGMQQRAAIARAIVTSPQILYMDEPFGALDAYTRLQMQRELTSFWTENKRTILFVTHSVEEAIFLGTRVIVMSSRPGEIIEDFKIDMPFPRDRWDKRFERYFKKLMELMVRESN